MFERKNDNRIKSKQSSLIIALSIVIILSIASSTILYSFLSNTATSIKNISINKIKSDALIQISDFKHILENKFEVITTNLDILVNTPSIRNQNLSATPVLDASQHTTNDFTESYKWLDANGKVLWTSTNDTNKVDNQQPFKIDESDKLYFKNVKETYSPDYGVYPKSVNESIPQILISYPILSFKDNNKTPVYPKEFGRYSTNFLKNNSEFRGVLVASIGVNNLKQFIDNNIRNQSRSSFIYLWDKNGLPLYSNNKNIKLKYTLNSPITISGIYKIDEGKNSTSLTLINQIQNNYTNNNNNINNLQIDEKQGKNIDEITLNDNILVNDKPFLYTYFVNPLATTDSTHELYSSQITFTFEFISFLLVIVFGFIIITLIINKNLEKLVKEKTSQLLHHVERLKESNEKLQHANNQLEISDKQQKEMLNITAHELRTPTQAITGYTEMALEHNNYKEFDLKNGKYLHIIEKNAIRLQNLIEQILDLARIESNNLILNKEYVNINNELENIVEEYNNKLHIVGTREDGNRIIEVLFIKPAVDPIIVNVDKLRIYQVISNLINNAFNAINMTFSDINYNLNKKNEYQYLKTNKDTITLSVEISKGGLLSNLSPTSNYAYDDLKNKLYDGDKDDLVRQSYKNQTQKKELSEQQIQQSFVIIRIKDSGRGIPDKSISNLFTKFVSLDSKGIGLGLFIAKSIVDAHGGRIWAENNVDCKGATFSFSLPLME